MIKLYQKNLESEKSIKYKEIELAENDKFISEKFGIAEILWNYFENIVEVINIKGQSFLNYTVIQEKNLNNISTF